MNNRTRAGFKTLVPPPAALVKFQTAGNSRGSPLQGGLSRQIGLWCNGSIRGSNPLGQGSNPWGPVLMDRKLAK